MACVVFLDTRRLIQIDNYANATAGGHEFGRVSPTGAVVSALWNRETVSSASAAFFLPRQRLSRVVVL